jgi:hypothetical protein
MVLMAQSTTDLPHHLQEQDDNNRTAETETPTLNREDSNEGDAATPSQRLTTKTHPRSHTIVAATAMTQSQMIHFSTYTTDDIDSNSSDIDDDNHVTPVDRRMPQSSKPI